MLFGDMCFYLRPISGADFINDSLEHALKFGNRKLNQTDRIKYFKELGIKSFTRKDYLNVFKDISSATASRDLNKGIELKVFIKLGDKNKTNYKLK